MQFTGHSLPVHQSMSVPWDFYLVPFFQPSPPTRFLLITAIGMCHFLPVHHFGMACLAGSKVNLQHSGRSQLCSSLDGFNSARYFQVLQFLYQSFGDCTKSINYNWYYCHFHVPYFFQFPSKVLVLILLFAFFQFCSAISWDSKVHNSASSFFYHKVWSPGQD